MDLIWNMEPFILLCLIMGHQEVQRKLCTPESRTLQLTDHERHIHRHDTAHASKAIQGADFLDQINRKSDSAAV